MGWVSDFADSIVDKMKDTIIEWAESNLTSSMDILTKGLDFRRSDASLVSTLLTTDPTTYTAGGSRSIWTTVQAITNNAVVPIAGCILMIVLVNELIQTVISGNNFHDFDTSIFIKWIIKCVCGILLISNVFYICSGVFALGTWISRTALRQLNIINLRIPAIHISTSGYSFGQVAGIWLLSLVFYLVMLCTISIIVVVICSRMIEIFMYLGASPIPMATFMNQEWKQMGHNWLRGVIAVACQGLFIVICLSIFSTLFTNVVASLSSGRDVIMQMVFLIGFGMAMIFTILRSGQISKSIFGAH